MQNITIGYLTWNKNYLLEKTLKSHFNNGLFEIIKPENRFIFFQETNLVNDKKICENYECNYLGNTQNIGILNAFIELIENCKTEYFIFCENDFLLLESPDNYSLNKCFEDVINILINDKYAQIKLSNCKNPGFLYCTPSDKKSWLLQKHDDFPYKIESISWIPEPEKFYDCMKIYNLNYKWYSVSREHQKWSNHIYMCNTSYLKNVVVPLLKYTITNNNNLDIIYQGLEDALNNCNVYSDIDEIKELIILHNKRTIYSGGGNFFHNK
jgi:hypothetical protein